MSDLISTVTCLYIAHVTLAKLLADFPTKEMMFAQRQFLGHQQHARQLYYWLPSNSALQTLTARCINSGAAFERALIVQNGFQSHRGDADHALLMRDTKTHAE